VQLPVSAEVHLYAKYAKLVVTDQILGTARVCAAPGALGAVTVAPDR